MSVSVFEILNDPFAAFAGRGVLGFLLTYAFVHGATVLVYFGTAFFCVFMNHRRPERRIQARSAHGQTRRDLISTLQQQCLTSLCLTVGFYGQTSGWGFAPVDLSIWSFIGFLALTLVLFDTWFFWTHRLQHTKMLYRFHKPHHLVTAPTVWSNDAGGSVDTLISHCYFAFILLILPMPAVVLMAARVFDLITNVVGHSGFEHFASPAARRPFPLLCTVYHDQHHKYFRYNYGNYFSFWDRICGTVHPTYDDTVVAYEAQYEQEKG